MEDAHGAGRFGRALAGYQVASNHTNQDGPLDGLATAFRQQHGEDLVVTASFDGIRMLGQAIAEAASTDPSRVAARLSGLSFQGFSGPVRMRAEDHQLQRACTSRAGRR
jgi:ABC-type branched-subunit amino acid transport system substrate-binding protein